MAAALAADVAVVFCSVGPPGLLKTEGDAAPHEEEEGGLGVVGDVL